MLLIYSVTLQMWYHKVILLTYCTLYLTCPFPTIAPRAVPTKQLGSLWGWRDSDGIQGALDVSAPLSS